MLSVLVLYLMISSKSPVTLSGIIILPLKERVRTLLLVNSYRGITLTSAFAKVLEILLLNRMSVILNDSSDPVVHLAELVCAD